MFVCPLCIDLNACFKNVGQYFGVLLPFKKKKGPLFTYFTPKLLIIQANFVDFERYNSLEFFCSFVFLWNKNYAQISISFRLLEIRVRDSKFLYILLWLRLMCHSPLAQQQRDFILRRRSLRRMPFYVRWEEKFHSMLGNLIPCWLIVI